MNICPKDSVTLIAGALLFSAAFGVSTTSAATPASPPLPEATRAAVLKALSACRGETDSTARLACFDKAAGALDEAEAKGQVMVLDREAVRDVRRQAFGLDLSALSLFQRVPSAPTDRVDRVSLTLDRAFRGGDGKWRFVSDEGAVWAQTDDEDVRTPPRKGSTMAVRQAALGSYFCNIDGQRAVRCARQH